MENPEDDLLGEELEPLVQDGPDLFAAPDDAEPPAPPAAPPREAPDVPVRRHTDDGEVTESLVEVVAALRPPAAPSRPEAPLALYRRYRPDTFADVIGQEHVTDPLQRALVNNRVNHAYLFSGPRGCGKTSSARILARALNCEQGPTPVPCGVCQSCRDLSRGGPGSIDVIEIDAASHGGVDDARDLRERAFFAPVHSRYKIYIVDEAHMVTTAGFNALLKVVEEPPPHVKFIFATTEPEKVIGTIRSRTHHYPFRLVPPKVLSTYLGTLCTAEGVTVDQSVLPLVVRAGAGSVRDSLSVLDQLLGGAGEDGVTYSQAVGLLGYTPDALLDEIIDAFAAGDAHGVFAAVDKVIEVGQDPRRFAEDLLRRLRDLIIVAAVPDALSSGLVEVADDQADRLRAQATTLGPGELARAAEVIATGLTEMRGTTAPRLHLELMCARVLLPGADVDARGVHARLDRLERRLGVGGAPGGIAEVTREGSGPADGSPRSAARGQAEVASDSGRPGARGDRAPGPVTRDDRASSPARDGRGPSPTSRDDQSPDAGAPVRSSSPAPAAASNREAPDETVGARGSRPAGSGRAPVPDGPPWDEEPSVAAGAPAGRGRPSDGPPTPERGAVGRPPADRDAGRPRADRDPAGPPSADRDAAGRPFADRDPAGRPSVDREAAGRPSADRDAAGRPPADRDAVGRPSADRDAGARPSADRDTDRRPPTGRDADVPAGTDDAYRADRAAGREAAGGSPANREAPVRPAADRDTRPPGGTAAPAAGPGVQGRSGALTTADFRRLWPNILTEVRDRRRYTWILLTQNAHVVDALNGVLTLGLSNPGARDSFSKGGSEEVLRESILAVAGEAVRIDAIVAPTDGSGPSQPTQAPAAPAAPARAPEPPPASRPEPPRPAAAVEARSNIRPTRTASSPETAAADEPEPSRDDANLDEGTGDHAELLAQQLGAELIAEE